MNNQWVTMLQTASGIEYQKQGIAWKGGAWTGRGLAYVAEVPVVGDFLDGMMAGYAAQRAVSMQNKMARQLMESNNTCPQG